MPPLIIRHLPGPTPEDDRFQLDFGGHVTAPVRVPAAAGYPVEGRPNDDLMSELRWYLEDFLEYPFQPETDHAERVLRALGRWATEVRDALLDTEEAAALLDGAREGWRLQVRSANPRVLSWPWEALLDLDAAEYWSVERSVDGLDTPVAPIDDLPRHGINVLLVTCRPYEGDVSFRSISRPLVEMVETEELPVHVHVLRPPTFERLQEHLVERPRHYHILHFDGHGSYRPTMPRPNAAFDGVTAFQLRTMDAQKARAYEGCLAFEDELGADRLIRGEELSELLSKHSIPVVVLNACQSGMLDAAAETAFASVAASLLQAGTRSVVAMAYSLMVSGAQEFLPAFYRGFFKSGDVSTGMRSGRAHMHKEKGRVCVRGRFDLEDWLVPVLYQRREAGLPFAAEFRQAEREKAQVLELGGDLPNAFVGRDGAILQLERAMRRPETGLLIHGLGGVGKTTLAKGFVRWLAQTEGLDGCLWFTLQEIRSAEYILNRLGEPFFESKITLLKAEQKIALLAKAFEARRFVIVWDNFEIASGTIGTEAHLQENDRELLKTLLAALRGGQTKVVITSRSEEHWLAPERSLLSLVGLHGEERWSYCEEILSDLEMDVDRCDPELKELMDVLEGHPLSMRVILPELNERRAGDLLATLRSVDQGDATAKLHATLGFAEEALDESLRRLLVPLALHERCVDGNLLQMMADQIQPPLSRAQTDTLLRTLSAAGLLRKLAPATFEMHPALTGFLRASTLQATDASVRRSWTRSFANIFGRLADTLAPRPFHEQRLYVYLHSANFLGAAEAAERLEIIEHAAALRQVLGIFAQRQQLYSEAAKQYEKYAALLRWLGKEKDEAGAYHQLGTVAQERCDLFAAENWYKESLKINERIGNEHGAAVTYHQFGRIAEDRGDLDAAEKWYLRSIDVKERLGIEHGVAVTCHQLGRIAENRRDFDTARRWYQKALNIFEKIGNEHQAAACRRQLGRIAQERRDFAAAERLCRQALNIELADDELAAGRTYAQLGAIADGRRDFATAEKWFLKALNIFEKLGSENDAAKVYGLLGVIAKDRRDFNAAKAWYQKSLNIEENLDDKGRAAATYGELGILAVLQEDFEESSHWLIKSIRLFLEVNDSASAQQGADNFLVIFNHAPPQEQTKLRSVWEDAKLPICWPDDAPED